MKIVVCVKQVPNSDKVKIDPIKQTLIRTGVENIMNINDQHAMEKALTIRSLHEGHEKVEIIAITVGPKQAEDVIYECLARGADKGYVITDSRIKGSDTLATSKILGATIKKIGDVDLVITGEKSSDGETGQIAPQIAEYLDFMQATFAIRAHIDDDIITVIKKSKEGTETISGKLPCVISVSKEINIPKNMKIGGIYNNLSEKIQYLSLGQLEIDFGEIGIEASPTRVNRTFIPPKNSSVEMVDGEDVTEKVSKLLLKMEDVFRGGINE